MRQYDEETIVWLEQNAIWRYAFLNRAMRFPASVPEHLPPGMKSV